MMDTPVDPPAERVLPSDPAPSAPRLWPGLLAWSALCIVYLALDFFGIVDGLWLAVPVIAALVAARALDQWPGTREWTPVLGGFFAGALLFGGLALLGLYPRWSWLQDLANLQEIVPAFLALGVVSFFFLIRWVRVSTLRAFGLKPRSAVHTVSAVMFLGILVLSASIIFLLRGHPGEEVLLRPTDPLFYLLIGGGVALAGAGFLLSRDLRTTLTRLDFRKITLRQVGWSLVVAALMLAVAGLLTHAGSLLFPGTFALEERYRLNFTGMPPFLGPLLMASAAGAGEEAVFRGAMQPRFGIIPTALLSAAIHTQYQLPTIAVLFVIDVATGLIKERTSTTFVVCVHTFYDLAAYLLPDF